MSPLTIICSNDEDRKVLSQLAVGKLLNDFKLGYELDRNGIITHSDVPSNNPIDSHSPAHASILMHRGDPTFGQHKQMLTMFEEMDARYKLIVINGTGSGSTSILPQTFTINGIQAIAVGELSGGVVDQIIKLLNSSPIQEPTECVYVINERAFKTETSALAYAKRHLHARHILDKERDIGWNDLLAVASEVFDIRYPEERIVSLVSTISKNLRSLSFLQTVGYNFDGIVPSDKSTREEFYAFMDEVSTVCIEKFDSLTGSVDDYNNVITAMTETLGCLQHLVYTIEKVPIYD